MKALLTSNIVKLLSGDAFYQDKSLFIKEWMEHETEVTCILRPSGFGKTLMITLMEHFLSRQKANFVTRFSQLAILQETDFVKQHMGRYPVFRLDLSCCEGLCWEEMKHNFLQSFEIACQALGLPAIPTFSPVLLRWATSQAQQLYDQNVIVLIDGFDHALLYAQSHGYYDKAIAFFHQFYYLGLNSPGLEKACVLGQVNLPLWSHLTNVKVCTVYDARFDSFFGLVGERDPKVIEWYGNHLVGHQNLVHPWAFTNYLMDQNFDFFLNSSFPHFFALKQHMKPMLPAFFRLVQHPIIIPAIQEPIDYSKPFVTDCIWSFLVQKGYLNYTRLGPHQGQVSLANKRLVHFWDLQISNLLTLEHPELDKLVEYCQGDLQFDQLESLFGQALSWVDALPQDWLNDYFYGLFKHAFKLKNATISLYQEFGRRDIRLHWPLLNRLLSFSFKHGADERDTDARLGLLQIKDQNFLNELKDCECVLVYGTVCGSLVKLTRERIERK